ncbi:unnamed protein product [Dovyalis caffra]|uniref:Uncharacterized protein n=1 Tax=Dovyalis caffra TaxID=77055 RepID=A0AAV1SKW7_9ROSI|nr:unnamed protein product [Dovyalis caffra]
MELEVFLEMLYCCSYQEYIWRIMRISWSLESIYVGNARFFVPKSLAQIEDANFETCKKLADGYTSSSESDFSDIYHHLSVGRKQKSITGRRKVQSILPSSKYRCRNYHSHCCHHVRLKTREVSVHLKGESRRLRNSRQL